MKAVIKEVFGDVITVTLIPALTPYWDWKWVDMGPNPYVHFIKNKDIIKWKVEFEDEDFDI